MAIVVETVVPRASRAEAEQFDADVEAAMIEQGGPPAGLMVHFMHPVGDGFVLRNVWRGREEMQRFYDAVILPRLAAAALDHEEPTVSEVWTFARP
jgi:hypothetical protein